MASNTNDKAVTLKAEGIVSTCPGCGYLDGFHVSFHMANTVTREAEVVLICPNCHKRFTIGWKVRFE